MKRQYLKEGDRCYSTGCYLIYHGDGNYFSFNGWEEDTYFDGEPINFDKNEKPYIAKVKESVKQGNNTELSPKRLGVS